MSTETDMAERFPKDVAEHQMTVLRDDGLYRHVRFLRTAVNPETGKREKSSFYWFDLITWPGCLAVNGDCGSFLFSRTDDMFEFFRGGQINPQYWAEKVRGETRTERYSAERFRQLVTEHVNSGDEESPSLAREWPGLADAVEREIFGADSQWNTEYEEGAREALSDFSFGTTFKAACICGQERDGFTAYEDARLWLAAHGREKGAGHRALHIRTIDGFSFADAWEWNLGDWDWKFLWCCHAIQWGIGRYDEGHGSVKRPAETVELPA